MKENKTVAEFIEEYYKKLHYHLEYEEYLNWKVIKIIYEEQSVPTKYKKMEERAECKIISFYPNLVVIVK
jgi:hypothetical protein